MLTLAAFYYGIGAVLYGGMYFASPMFKNYVDENLPRLGRTRVKVAALALMPLTWPQAILTAWRNR